MAITFEYNFSLGLKLKSKKVEEKLRLIGENLYIHIPMSMILTCFAKT
jgi:hypothetical protein